MYCRRCGCELTDSVNFCGNCGEKVEIIPEANLSAQTHPRGYVSEEAKRRFTITAGVLGALFFFGQMILPMLFMPFFMPFGFFKKGMDIKEIVPDRGAYFDGKIFVVEDTNSINFNDKGVSSKYVLRFLEPGDEKLSDDDVIELNVGKPWVLAGEDRLWLVSKDSVGYLLNGEIRKIRVKNRLGDITRPFMVGDRPAVIEDRPDGMTLKVFHDGEWVTKEKLKMDILKDENDTIRDYIQAIEVDDRIFIFRERGNSIYLHKGLPVSGNGDEWELVGSSCGEWLVAVVGGVPAIFVEIETRSGGRVVGHKYEDGKWKQFFVTEKGMSADFAVYPMGTQDGVAYVSLSLPGNFKVVIYEGKREISTTKYGGGFPFPGAMFRMMALIYLPMLLMPILLAVILAAMMGKSRVCDYTGGGGAIPYASLTRRAAAQIIDLPFLCWPIMVGYYLMFRNFQDMENMFNMLYSMGLILGGIVWLMLMIVVFGYTEGRWGKTPGKLAMGITVLGADLAPCGFWRGVLRNILMFADGFFNWMVGILLVAFTEDWQRVGDMAARTVVLKISEEQRRRMRGLI